MKTLFVLLPLFALASCKPPKGDSETYLTVSRLMHVCGVREGDWSLKDKTVSLKANASQSNIDCVREGLKGIPQTPLTLQTATSQEP